MRSMANPPPHRPQSEGPRSGIEVIGSFLAVGDADGLLAGSQGAPGVTCLTLVVIGALTVECVMIHKARFQVIDGAREINIVFDGNRTGKEESERCWQYLFEIVAEFITLAAGVDHSHIGDFAFIDTAQSVGRR